MMKTLAMLLMLTCTSCVICTAPMSVSWRSNTSQQYATTDGKNDKEADANNVNADKSSELKSAVSTSSGNSSASGEKGHQKDSEKDSAHSDKGSASVNADSASANSKTTTKTEEQK